MSVLSVLKERGFVEDLTHTEELEDYLSNNRVTCYIGFDPTAASLHVGSLVCIMALAHMQRHGHRPIALVGGGTGLIGDPSGKTELRKVITQKEIDENKKGLRNQLSRFLDFSEDKALLLDNASWLTKLEYIPFLRDIGRHFSVNRMVKAESYKARMDSEDGLTFIEFNYMLLQSYDFMQLAKSYDCFLQMGGSDQWGNIVAGIDLTRRTIGKQAFGITFPLITTASGIKMGKTHKGAVWLDAQRFSPYEYYQFWVNADDADVARFLALFTFLPLEEINQVGHLKGADLNKAKAVLAFEATRICHGEDEAIKALEASVSMFGGLDIPGDLLISSSIPRKTHLVINKKSVPSSSYNKDDVVEKVSIIDLFMDSGLCKSKSDARRLIQQGGAYINGDRVASFDQIIISEDIKEDEILLRAGKKKYHKIILI
ncbi:MAG: tyrosine--tRNA ligase [Desulfobacula sp.]|jgi:tyrosyl-tRNA synthetase|uniref:tyrosine--tRNA ligase n=1 Tax=Desulfobacula sp. TaxID=2593537 RepID=UPI001DD26ED2|nr:tyrosine--tRNA ligase [Desulfobacula sp.]MBT3485933.1 tyrosine--tRNA ligase [Desulfobacula sp.]MBT3805421.1 tyrosine--tRNA ligase [Desulfobacula sp.]MBT4026010.1 tyrosine--tRNA ligase [Desulfobacula sp.]MBT4199071.1 tyrosine--tRNA ligase [Desulfobacula sp.]